MMSLGVCVLSVMMLLLTHTSADLLTNDVQTCPTNTEESSLCPMEPSLRPCVLRCRHHVPPEGREMVGEGSECYDGSSAVVKCVDGQWIRIVTGQRSRRVKRGGWWFWIRRSRSRSAPTQYPPDITCPGDITVTAPGGKTSAIVTWTVPTASDPNGDTPSISRTKGQGPGSSFPEGESAIEYTARDSTGRTESCSFTVRVTVTRCPEAQRRTFGSPGTQTCRGGEEINVYGSQCEHSCPTGYTLAGSSSVLCQNSGQWNSTFPRCQIVTCGVPDDVAGGQVNCPAGRTYGKSCLLQCRTGYTSPGPSLTTCSSGGHWAPTLRPCADTEPPKFPNGCPDDLSLFSGPLRAPVNVTWPDPVVTDNGPDPVTLTTDPAKGSGLGVGVHTVAVKAVDKAGNEASCTFLVSVVAKECPPLSHPSNGHVTCTSGHVEGSECSFDCRAGFEIQGRLSLTCLGTEQWDSAVPTCQAIECPSPPEVERASFLCLQGHQFPAECTLTCDPGYSVVGAGTIECQANRTWTQHGTCSDSEAPQFVTPCPGDLGMYASRLGEETLVTWPPLQVTDNSGHDPHLTCNVTNGASFPPGLTVVTCVTLDESGNSRSCHFAVNVSVLQCSDPGISVNNQSQLLFTCPDGHVYGARCTLRCPEGYSLLGTESLVCEKEPDTYPPLMKWEGSHGRLVSKPECKVDNCPRLEPPQEGSLSCLLGPVAWDCLLQCHSGWDVSARHLPFDGHFLCNALQGRWVPPLVPDCVVRRSPYRVQLYSDLFYLTTACRGSQAVIRDHFITRLTTSLLKDACVHVPSCVARNVKVTCGPVSEWDRSKRAADQRFRSRGHHTEDGDIRLGKREGRRGGGASHYVRVSFGVMLFDRMLNSSLSDTQLFQAAQRTKEWLTHSLAKRATSGQLTPAHVHADVSRVGSAWLHVQCPPGTVLRPQHLSADRFSCVGCSKGYFLPPSTTECQPCPLGHFAPGDSATSCLPCPPGMTTPSVGASDPSLCQPGAGV